MPVIVFFHGGGWVLGNVVNYDPLCTHLATEVGAVVVSVDYRLAPEHPAPTAAHDAVDATTWIAAQSDVLRADAHRLAVCGDSAGANLAAVVAQAVRDGGADWIRHQALLYPATDLTMASPSIDEHAHAPILTRTSILAFREHYAAGQDWKNPLVSPLFGGSRASRPRWSRPRTSTRSVTTAPGMPWRCGPRVSRPASRTTSGSRTASRASRGQRRRSAAPLGARQ